MNQVYEFYGNDGYCINCEQPLEGRSCPYCGWDDKRPPQYRIVPIIEYQPPTRWWNVTHYVPTWKWLLKFWAYLLCSHGWHLFDEYASVEKHVLFCDACELSIPIDSPINQSRLDV
jgi:hypothetical protein